MNALMHCLDDRPLLRSGRGWPEGGVHMNAASGAPQPDPSPMNPDAPLFDATGRPARRSAGPPDSPAPPSFDRLTRLAAQLLRVPVALVSLVDDQRPFCPGPTGPGDGPGKPWATPPSHYLCRHVVETGEPLLINDARNHALVRDNPALAAMKFAAYAGLPLKTDEGHTLGCFCVIDHQPRVWQPGEIGLLSELAACVMTEIALHQAGQERAALESQLRQKQKLEALGTLAAGLAHEFNNLLGAILGNAVLARQDVGPHPAALESLEEISKAGRRARALVQQVLGFVRHEPVARRLVPLRPIVEESAGLLRATLPREVELVVTCANDAPPVLADATQVGQVILNLVTNAWHALENQPGRITLALDATTVDAASPSAPGLPAGHYARITVSDAGRGMEPATLARIFEPFFTTKPVGEGTGLGLSIVQDIMQAHQGVVRATSRPGQGTVFTLHFPAATGEPVATPPPPAEPARGRGESIWFLDDDENIVLLATRTLNRLGYQVSGFTDSDAALRAFEATPDAFAVAVTDSNMPGPSGIKIAARLRALRPELPVILTTGYITEPFRKEVQRAGIRHLIYKPNTSEELGAAIHAVLTATRCLSSQDTPHPG